MPDQPVQDPLIAAYERGRVQAATQAAAQEAAARAAKNKRNRTLENLKILLSDEIQKALTGSSVFPEPAISIESTKKDVFAFEYESIGEDFELSATSKVRFDSTDEPYPAEQPALPQYVGRPPQYFKLEIAVERLSDGFKESKDVDYAFVTAMNGRLNFAPNAVKNAIVEAFEHLGTSA